MPATPTPKSLRVTLLGLVVLGAGIGWTAAHFKNPDGSSFNPRRNFVSELGSQKLSRASVVFNASLIVSSLLFFPLVRDLAARLDSKMRRAALTTGTCALIGVIGCGFASFIAWMFAAMAHLHKTRPTPP